jgi:6-phosphofructokinase 1
VTAAIVTCGGLCPGLNNVIRELVHALHHLYSVDSILGIKYPHLPPFFPFYSTHIH